MLGFPELGFVKGDIGRPLTLSRLLVTFIMHPSLIIFAASWAVFRASSKPERENKEGLGR